MRATSIMLLGVGALIFSHWAHNKKTVNTKMVIELAFVIIVIAALDQGKTEQLAKGFAWLFLAAVLLAKDSVLDALPKVAAAPSAQPRLVKEPVTPDVAPVQVQQAPPGYGYGY